MCFGFYFVFLYLLHFLSVSRVALWEHSFLTIGSSRVSPNSECGGLFCWIGLYSMLMGLWISHVQNSICKKRGKNGMSILTFWTLNCPLFGPPKLLWAVWVAMQHRVTMISQQEDTCKETHTGVRASTVKWQAEKWTVHSRFSFLSFFFKTQQKADICQVCITNTGYRKKDNWGFVSLFMNSPAYY